MNDGMFRFCVKVKGGGGGEGVCNDGKVCGSGE